MLRAVNSVVSSCVYADPDQDHAAKGLLRFLRLLADCINDLEYMIDQILVFLGVRVSITFPFSSAWRVLSSAIKSCTSCFGTASFPFEQLNQRFHRPHIGQDAFFCGECDSRAYRISHAYLFASLVGQSRANHFMAAHRSHAVMRSSA